MTRLRHNVSFRHTRQRRRCCKTCAQAVAGKVTLVKAY